MAYGQASTGTNSIALRDNLLPSKRAVFLHALQLEKKSNAPAPYVISARTALIHLAALVHALELYGLEHYHSSCKSCKLTTYCYLLMFSVELVIRIDRFDVRTQR